MSNPWYADPNYGQAGDPPHPLNEKRRMSRISRAEAKQAVTDRATDYIQVMTPFTTGEPWAVNDVLDLIDTSDVGWVDHVYRHDLLVVHNKRVYYIDVPQPAGD